MSTSLSSAHSTQRCYYYSLTKMLLVCAACCAFVVACVWMLPDAKNHWSLTGRLTLFACLVFFGFCALVALVFVALRVARPRPWLVLDERGVTYYAGVLSRSPNHTRTIPWADVKEIAIYRLRSRTGRGKSALYLLTFSPQDPIVANLGAPDGELGAFSLAVVGKGGIAIPLNMYFLACTATRRAALLRDIQRLFASQIRCYGINVDERLRER